MSTVSAPFGLKPIYHPSGQLKPTVLNGGIASGYAADLFLGTPVAYGASTGTIIVGTTSGAIVGSFAGVEYTGADGRRRTTGYWPASTVATNIVASFHSDPATIYAIQANGPLAQTAIINQANLINPGTGSTTTQVSSCAISTTLVGNGVQGTLRILDLYNTPENAWGDAYTIVVVNIARHQLTAIATAIA
jgi:hypothetical protein